MTGKKRVHEIAKEYGLTGQDLARRLNDWGFPVKSHMTAVDDMDMLRIQGMLEANGFTMATAAAATAAPAAEEDGLSGLIVRRKKRKKAEGDEPETPGAATVQTIESAPSVQHPAAEAPAAKHAVEEAPAATPAAAPSAKAAEPTAAPTASSPTAAAKAAPLEAPETAAPAPAVSKKAAPATPKHPEPAPAQELKPAAKPSAPKRRSGPRSGLTLPTALPTHIPADMPAVAEESEVTAEAEPVVEEPNQAETAQVAESPAVTPPTAVPEVLPAAEVAPAAAEAPGTVSEDNDIVRPSAARRSGKVVGFIDLSTRQTDKPVKRESRRLGSGEDATVNVQPTRGNLNRRSPVRPGENSGRSDLTTSQLREREAGRVLRRSGGRPSGPPQRGGRRGGGGGSAVASSSPMSGGAVKVEQPVSVKKLADAIAVKQNEVLKRAWELLGFGSVNINSVLDEETATLVAGEFGVDLEITREVAAEEALLAELSAKRKTVGEEELVSRPPTVAVLGHVDHGKTTLIDALRKSSLTRDESGGITQHIGAYQIETKLGHLVTVVDTPGHAAFTAMRARGAKAVDLVILVVAADDGVMPQTAEAINHAKAAKVPIVVAMNKIDKVDANPDKVLAELASNDLTPEEWGGQTAVMRVSALKNLGLEELMERVFLEGELLELKSHPTGPASGVVLEAEIQQGRGIIAHLLVQDGSLRRGDVILAGEGYGKVRAIHDDRGNTIEEAGPARPVEVTGLDKIPGVGERFHVVPDLADAKQVAEDRSRQLRMASLADRRSISRENLFEAVADSEKKAINLIVKADVQGSVEVLKSQLAELTHDEVEVKVLHAGVGPVSESDVDLAVTSDATIMAFHVGANGKARQNAERGKVEIRNYEVIYVMLDDVRKMMEGSLSPEIVEEITGHVEIRRLFRSSRIGNIAGSHVIDGKIFRDSKIRLLRDGIVVFTGQLASLRRESDDAKEVREGFDCGLVVRDYNDIREGDVVEAFKLNEVKRRI